MSDEFLPTVCNHKKTSGCVVVVIWGARWGNLRRAGCFRGVCAFLVPAN